jgi:hypothetical protein
VLARWVIAVLDTLSSVLKSKSRTFLRPKSVLAENLFILNNLSEAEHLVRGDKRMQGIISCVTSLERENKRSSRGSQGSANPVAATFSMPKTFEKAKRAGLDGLITSCCCRRFADQVGYLDGYKDAVSHLLDVTYIKGGGNRSSGSLTGKERDAVKERFKVAPLPPAFPRPDRP